MKKEATVLGMVLFIMTGFGGCKQLSGPQGDIITVDVTIKYPEKELILQDFMDVEYIALETNDEFVTQGDVIAIGNEFILTKNWVNDGNIFIFDRKTGKGVRKINRWGQGAEEYAFINGVVMDKDNNELFVNSTSTKKIYVYDLYGNFKRSLKHTEDTEYLYIFDFNKDNLICYDISGYNKDGENKDNQSFHVIISKQDGSVTRNIPIPFDVIKAPVVRQGDGVVMSTIRPIIPYHDNCLLVETSSDTVYKYVSKENQLTPFLVKKSSAGSEVFLTMGTLTDRYYFMETVKKVFDFTTGRGFPMSDLMYDKEENAIFSPTVLNADFIKKQSVDMTSKPVNSEIATFQNLSASGLVEAYENDQLKGKLKELAAELDEESNPVIMLIKYKK